MRLLLTSFVWFLAVTALTAFAVSGRSASAFQPVQQLACACSNDHHFQFDMSCGVCVYQVTSETYNAGQCDGSCHQTAECDGSVTYSACGASHTAHCQAECGGQCSSTPRCGSLTIECAECHQL
jgi:hypothetical protein